MAVKLRRKKILRECDGCVSGPMQTVFNTGGIGNAVPGQIASMTGADQCSQMAIGSGDLFGTVGKMNTQTSASKKKRRKVKFRKH